MIVDISPYEIFLIGAACSAYLIRSELQHRKYISVFKNICFAIGLKPRDMDII